MRTDDLALFPERDLPVVTVQTGHVRQGVIRIVIHTTTDDTAPGGRSRVIHPAPKTLKYPKSIDTRTYFDPEAPVNLPSATPTPKPQPWPAFAPKGWSLRLEQCLPKRARCSRRQGSP